MKRFVALGIFFIFAFMIQDVATGASGSRVLKEVVGADQVVKQGQGAPLIVSKKTNIVGIMPKTILIPPKAYIQFSLVINNRTTEPLKFSVKDIRVFSGDKDFPVLEADKVAEEARKEYSKEYSNLSKEQKKAMLPFIEDKMQRARKELIEDQTIAPKENGKGLFAVDVPLGTKKLSVEVKTTTDTHQFNFQIFDI